MTIDRGIGNCVGVMRILTFHQLSIQLQVNDARVYSYSIIYAMTLCASTILMYV